MEILEKYLPPVEDRILFIQNRINENKKQMLGGQLEILMAEANGEKRNIKVTEDQMEQIIKNIDIYQEELDRLGE